MDPYFWIEYFSKLLRLIKRIGEIFLCLGIFLKKVLLFIWKPTLRLSILIIPTIIIFNLLYQPLYSYLNERVAGRFHSYEGCYSPNGLIPTPISANYQSASASNKDVMVKAILEDKINNVWFDKIIDTHRLLNYGMFVKNTTNIASWRVSMTEPKETIVPVVLVANINNKNFRLSYEEEKLVTEKLLDFKELIDKKHEINVDGVGIEPQNQESIKGLLGPDDALKIETLDHEKNPITLDGATRRSENQCLLIFYMRPVELSFLVKVAIHFFVFIFVFILLTKCLSFLLKIYNFIARGSFT